MTWLDQQVSLYTCMADNTGRPATLREVLLWEFAVPHKWFQREHKSGEWISDTCNDLETMIALRTQEMTKAQQVMLKGTMQCFTPAGLFKTKKKGQVEVISRTGLMQLDFDHQDIKDYDIEELKQAVFSLPFVAFCGLSCSGKGFYALVQIAEPEKLPEYTEHCFEIFKQHAIPPDTSKGRNVNDLRFVSYDASMLIRENPEPLKVKHFKPKPATVAHSTPRVFTTGGINRLVDLALSEISAAVVGGRWQTVQRCSYTFGGLGNKSFLEQIKNCINNTPAFAGEEKKYLLCAEKCFRDGSLKPLPVNKK